ncbi:MAG: hypothetical protein M9955_09795 [Rhizobiaceae bacterium]|nr:hypothetical protein [Rhizobiaceae bacterium]
MSNVEIPSVDLAQAVQATATPKVPKPRKGKPEFDDPPPVPLADGGEGVKPDSSPFGSSDFRVVIYAYVGFALRILLVFGAVFSVVQYLQQRAEARVNRTLDLVEMWERSEYQSAQKALKDRLVAANAQNQSLLGANPTEAESRIYFSRLGRLLLTDAGGEMPLHEFQDHFDRVVYFLNRISSCVTNNICDRDVANDYFLDYARSFWSYFSGYAAEVRASGSPNFANPIEEYVTSEAENAPAPAPAAAK